MTHLLDLPEDALIMILTKLPFKEACRASVVHSQLNSASKQVLSWSVKFTAKNCTKITQFLNDRCDHFENLGYKCKKLSLDFSDFFKSLPNLRRLLEFTTSRDDSELEIISSRRSSFLLPLCNVGKVSSFRLQNLDIAFPLIFSEKLNVFDFKIGSLRNNPLIFDFHKCSNLGVLKYEGDRELSPEISWPMSGNLVSVVLCRIILVDHDLSEIMRMLKNLKGLVLEECQGLDCPYICSSTLLELSMVRCSPLSEVRLWLPLLQTFCFGHEFDHQPKIICLGPAISPARSELKVLLKGSRDFDIEIWQWLKDVLSTSSIRFNVLNLIASHQISVSFETEINLSGDFGIQQVMVDGYLQGASGSLLLGIISLKPNFLEFEIDLCWKNSDNFVRTLSRLQKTINFKLDVNADSLLTDSRLKVMVQFMYDL